MIVKGYKYRLNPTNQQKKFLNTCFDVSRFVWNSVHASYNHYLESRCFQSYDSVKKQYTNFVDRNFMNRQVTLFVNQCYADDLMPWFKPKHIPKRAIETIVKDYFETWKRFFKCLKNGDIQKLRDKKIQEAINKGFTPNWSNIKEIGKPNFKPFFKDASFRSDRGIILDLDRSVIKFSGQEIPVILHRIPEGVFKIKTITLSKTGTGKYFCSAVVWHEKEQPKKVEIKNTVGIDFGVKDFATLSNGKVYSNPRFLKKNQQKLKRLQRKLSRQTKGSNRWKTTKKKIALVHEQTANRRSNFIHNVTSELTKEFDLISIENLNVSGMTSSVKGKIKEDGSGFEKTNKAAKSGLNKAILDVAPYEFKRQLKYKTDDKGKHYSEVDRYFPSSKLCSVCDTKNTKLELKHRKWTCCNCGITHDRDYNAALNIDKQGAKVYSM